MADNPCTSKRGGLKRCWGSREQAEDIARHLPYASYPYHCKACGFWHLSQRKQPPVKP